MDPTPTPNTNIVTASAAGGATALIIIAVVNYALPGFEIDPLLGGAVGTLCTLAWGAIIKPSGGSN